jgi:hypothetical protein
VRGNRTTDSPERADALRSTLMRGQRQLPALIEAWFDLMPTQQQANARALHDLVRRTVPAFEGSLRGGCLVYSLQGVHAMALAPFRTHMHVQVFHSATLLDRFPELDGSGRGLRQLRLRHGQPFDEMLVQSLVQAVAREAVAAQGLKHAL